MKLVINLCLFLTILIFPVISTGMMQNPKRYRYLVPEDFVGTIKVYYSVKGADKLKNEDGYDIIFVSDSGIVKTSSDPVGGKFHDEFMFYKGENRYLMPASRIGGGGTIKQKNQQGEVEVYFQIEILK